MRKEVIKECMRKARKQAAILIGILLCSLLFAHVKILDIMANDRITLQTQDAELIFISLYLFIAAIALVAVIGFAIAKKRKPQIMAVIGVGLCVFFQLPFSEIYWQNLSAGSFAIAVLVAICADVFILTAFVVAGESMAKKERKAKTRKKGNVMGAVTREEKESSSSTE